MKNPVLMALLLLSAEILSTDCIYTVCSQEPHEVSS